MCAVCGQRIELSTEEGRSERTYRLNCKHLYPREVV